MKNNITQKIEIGLHKVFSLKIMVIGLFFCGTVYGQGSEERVRLGFSIPELAHMDIEHKGKKSLEFEILPGAEPGEKPLIRQTKGDELWINYSSAVKAISGFRSIEAQVVNGNIPSGIELFVQASDYSGTGKGEMGISSGKVVVDAIPRAIVSNIGSCYTGDGINKGHLLNFFLEINNMQKLSAVNASDFTILYTITDH